MKWRIPHAGIVLGRRPKQKVVRTTRAVFDGQHLGNPGIRSNIIKGIKGAEVLAPRKVVRHAGHAVCIDLGRNVGDVVIGVAVQVHGPLLERIESARRQLVGTRLQFHQVQRTLVVVHGHLGAVDVARAHDGLRRRQKQVGTTIGSVGLQHGTALLGTGGMVEGGRVHGNCLF